MHNVFKVHLNTINVTGKNLLVVRFIMQESHNENTAKHENS